MPGTQCLEYNASDASWGVKKCDAWYAMLGMHCLRGDELLRDSMPELLRDSMPGL